MVEKKFEQPSGLKYGPGSTASGSDHRVIPEDEGGTRDDRDRYVMHCVSNLEDHLLTSLSQTASLLPVNSMAPAAPKTTSRSSQETVAVTRKSPICRT